MSQTGQTFDSERKTDFSNPLNFIRPDICFLGRVDDRGQEKRFGILRDDRLRHIYIIGKSGMGKSTLLENMSLQDIFNGDGVCFIDPHGESAENIIDRIPPHRHQDVIYFNPSDTQFPLGFNMLESKQGEEPFLIVSGMMSIFKKVWQDAWSSRMEYILNNTLLALTESPGNTLLGALRVFTDKKFRARIVDCIDDPMVSTFWKREFTSWSEKYRTEAIAPIQNKIGQFFSSELIRNILGQAHSTIDFGEIMDNRKIFIANLSKGRIGEDNSNLLGSMLVTKMQLSAMSRIDQTGGKPKPDFYIYVDEFQNFTTDSFATILSEARKYRLGLTIAHQYIAQLTEKGSDNVKNAVFGNAGTMLSFKIGAQDAYALEQEFSPTYASSDFLYLNRGQVIMKMTINGRNTTPFGAETLPPMFNEHFGGHSSRVVQLSRQKYGKPRELVKIAINDWMENQRSISEVKMSDQRIGNSTDNKLKELDKDSREEDLNDILMRRRKYEMQKIPSQNVLSPQNQTKNLQKIPQPQSPTNTTYPTASHRRITSQAGYSYKHSVVPESLDPDLPSRDSTNTSMLHGLKKLSVLKNKPKS